MSKRVKTTKIVKKYKDSKGQEKTIEIDHAKVVDRIKEFREDNPRGSIVTKPIIDGNRLIFEAHIIKDKSDANSAEATGHAFVELSKSEKQFEKLETIAVGRALAILGYAASGEVASFEEQEEFQAYKDNRIEEMIDHMNTNCKTVSELREYFMSLGSFMAESRIIEAKNKRKEELSNADSGSQAA